IKNELHELGIIIIKESLENMNQMLIDSPVRKNNWSVESHTVKSLITSLGTVRFRKTLFTNKESGEYEYLLDRILGLERNQRLTEDAEANMLEEAVQTSYRRGGEAASIMTDVSKQTVKNKIHQLKFPTDKELKKKKVVEYLYIEADEDHVSLQFQEKKGDLVTSANQQKNNCLIEKLVYIHEGIEAEAPESKRFRLIAPHYFCSTANDKSNQEFWKDIYQYIEKHYEVEKIKKIYLNADGGSWILNGIKQIPGAVYVLDEYHLNKNLTKLTSHMKDSSEDARKELREAIRNKTKAEFKEIVERLKEYLDGENGIERMNTASEYILSNWTAAKLRLRHKEGVIGSSTEGHVSHVLSSRMSSRPMGWSVNGATNMGKLRAYYLNGGDMLELIRHQKEELPKAVGEDYNILSAQEILRSEKKGYGEMGKYAEVLSHSISLQNKKKVYFNTHIWGL
ncbi:MAG: ISLre2 family transposase, partial [Eubacteriales bacterium]|nr:ISLre2 family transposase [Eubacteriales bacterium]